MNTTIDNFSQWLRIKLFDYLPEEQQELKIRQLLEIQQKLLSLAKIKPEDTVVEIGSGKGLLGIGAYKITANKGKVIISDIAEERIKPCREFIKTQSIPENQIQCKILDINSIDLKDNSVDVVLMKSVLAHIKNKLIALKEINRILKPCGKVCFYEPVVSGYTRNYQLVDIEKIDISQKIIDAEEKIWTDPENSFTNFDEYTIKTNLKAARFSLITVKSISEVKEYIIKDNMIDQWLTTPPAAGTTALKENLLKYLTNEEYEIYKKFLIENTLNKTVNILTKSIYSLAVKM